jgi:hypothetical protein
MFAPFAKTWSRAARVNDLIGPFDTWKEACDHAIAWRALWVQQRAKAFVETPITPCPDTMEWYQRKLERDDAAELARREARADDMFASEARETVAPSDIDRWGAAMGIVAKERGSIVRSIRAQNGLVD